MALIRIVGRNRSLVRALIRSSTTVPLLFVVVACSQLTYVNCDPHSWYGLGIRDGEKGMQPRVANEYERRCSHKSMVFDRLAYEAGLIKGNAQYCSGENAFYLGLSGVETKRVCANEDAVVFKEGLKTGRKMRKAVLDLDRSDFPTKYDLGGFTVAVSSSYILYQVAENSQGLEEGARGVWVPVMLGPRHLRGSDERVNRSVKSVELIARCEEAKQNAQESGFYTSLNCSPF